jgi:DNA-binding XRE family transcriptional regulator
MLAVVRTPRTRKPALEIRGRIPAWMLLRLKREYGKSLVVKEDPDELVDVFGTQWYRCVRARRHPGHALRIYRENAGLSQAQLGAKLGGVPRQNVSAMEKGRRGISKEMAKSLAGILKAPVERLL